MATLIKKSPSLSTMGWISTVEEDINKAFDWFVASEYSQSTLFKGSVLSLPYIIAQYSTQPDRLCKGVSDSLEELYRRRGYGCAATSTYRDSATSDAGFDIVLNVIITHENTEYPLGRTLRVLDNKIIGILDN